VLLGDALLHEELGRTMLQEKTRIKDEQARPELSVQERAVQEVQLQEYDLAMRQHLARATRDLDLLLKRGDLLLLTHKHMMSVKALSGDYAGALEHGQRYLERCATAQSAKQKVYESTLQVHNEQRAALELSTLVDDELTVRAQLADLHFDHGRYDRAVTELDSILRLDPGRSADYYNRARALYELGRYDEAFNDVQRFLATHNLPAGHATLTRAHDILRKIDNQRR
jgi:tetratricopeptide (TPR) repeat protein